MTTLTYELTAPGHSLARTVHDPIGTPVLDVVTPVRRGAGQHVVAFAAGALPDGAYTVALTARADDGTEIGASIPLRVTRTLGFGAVAPVRLLAQRGWSCATCSGFASGWSLRPR